MEAERFEDGGTFLWQLADVVLVRCPRCDRMARVARGADGGARLTCARCGLARAAERGARNDWVGPVCAYPDGRCGACGRMVVRSPRHLPHPPRKDTAVARCAGCGAQSRVRLKWWPLGAPEGRDPVFGLPLWLRAAFRGHLLWAYNARHLRFLERWVGATLRRRTPFRNGSMASRLPAWMTAAHARDDVMETLGRLRGLLTE